MFIRNFFLIISFSFILTNSYTNGQNLTNTTTITPTTTTTTTNETVRSLTTESSGHTVRNLFFLFLGCLLTTFLIIAMIMTFKRITGSNHRQLSTTTNFDLRSRFRNLFETIGLNNLMNNSRMNFFSVSNNNHSSQSHRQGETSRTHLNENQDEALLFDDPYGDGGITSGIHGSTANPYKSLTLTVT